MGWAPGPECGRGRNAALTQLTRRVSFGKRCGIKYKTCLIFYEWIFSGCARIWCSSNKCCVLRKLITPYLWEQELLVNAPSTKIMFGWMHPGECTLLTCVSCFGECTMDECIPKYRLSQSTHVSFCIYWFLHLKWRVGGTAPIFMCALKDFCPPSQSLLNTLFFFLTRRVSLEKGAQLNTKLAWYLMN